MDSEASATCGLVEADCVCIKPAEPHDDHVCECGGSWSLAGDDFKILALPGTAPEWPAYPFPFLGGDALDLLLAGGPMRVPRGRIMYAPPAPELLRSLRMAAWAKAARSAIAEERWRGR